jgi:hypothetical protein
VTSEIVTPAVQAWVERTVPGAHVVGTELRPLAGGAVARRVDQVTLHLAGRHDPVKLVRKQAPAHEIAGLRTAQAVRPDAAAIPELVAWGSDWLITPLAPGAPLDWGTPVPAGYARAWLRLTGQPLAAAALDEGYRWAALQLPVQYLPWTAGYRPTRDVEAALDRIERALSRLLA